MFNDFYCSIRMQICMLNHSTLKFPSQARAKSRCQTLKLRHGHALARRIVGLVQAIKRKRADTLHAGKRIPEHGGRDTRWAREGSVSAENSVRAHMHAQVACKGDPRWFEDIDHGPRCVPGAVVATHARPRRCFGNVRRHKVQASCSKL